MRKLLLFFILILVSCGGEEKIIEVIDDEGCIEKANCLEDQYCNQSYNICVPNYCITENIDCGDGICEPDDRYGAICVCNDGAILEEGVCVTPPCETYLDCTNNENKPFCENGECSEICITSSTSCDEGFQCNSEGDGCIEIDNPTDEKCVENGFDYLDYNNECRYYCNENSNPCGEMEDCIGDRCYQHCYNDQHCNNRKESCALSVGLCLKDACVLANCDCEDRDFDLIYCSNSVNVPSLYEIVDKWITIINSNEDEDSKIDCELTEDDQYICNDGWSIQLHSTVYNYPYEFYIVRDEKILGDLKKSEVGEFEYNRTLERGALFSKVYFFFYFPTMEIFDYEITNSEEVIDGETYLRESTVEYKQGWGGIPITETWFKISLTSDNRYNYVSGNFIPLIDIKSYDLNFIDQVENDIQYIRGYVYQYYESRGYSVHWIDTHYFYKYYSQNDIRLFLMFSVTFDDLTSKCLLIDYEYYYDDESIDGMIMREECQY